MAIDLEAMADQIREDGFCIVPDVIPAELLDRARGALAQTVDRMAEAGISAHSETLDPNDANIRVYHLPVWDSVFVELLQHPLAVALVEATIGREWIVSNFTANIALPGSGSMKVHSDQALVVPPPWLEPWAINIIWCFDDVHEGNGATRYVPGSQDWQSFDDVPQDLLARSRPFSAPAGSFIAMEGRVWHTSGANVSKAERRAMAFAYYTRDFIRPQVNWAVTLPQDVQGAMDEQRREMFGLGPMANIRIGGGLTRLREGPRPDVRTAV